MSDPADESNYAKAQYPWIAAVLTLLAFNTAILIWVGIARPDQIGLAGAGWISMHLCLLLWGLFGAVHTKPTAPERP